MPQENKSAERILRKFLLEFICCNAEEFDEELKENNDQYNVILKAMHEYANQVFEAAREKMKIIGKCELLGNWNDDNVCNCGKGNGICMRIQNRYKDLEDYINQNKIK